MKRLPIETDEMRDLDRKRRPSWSRSRTATGCSTSPGPQASWGASPDDASAIAGYSWTTI